MKPGHLIYFLTIYLLSCNRQPDNSKTALQARIDSLQKIINDAYKPGLGEFMSGIQLHHEKLWFAGKNANWDLADFEINEIKETVTDINNYCKDRPEIHFLPMIYPSLDSLNMAIQEKNSNSFKNDYIVLTNTCNSCHRVTKHAFNVIKVPDISSFSDQSFAAPAQPEK